MLSNNQCILLVISCLAFHLAEGTDTQSPSGPNSRFLREEVKKLKEEMKNEFEKMREDIQQQNLDIIKEISQLRKASNESKKEILTRKAIEADLREENLQLRRKVKEQSKNLTQLRDEVQQIWNVFNKPWFREEDIKVFNGSGYAVVESRTPWCRDRYPGGMDASVNNQAELDFISEAAGDREVYLGGDVFMEREDKQLSYEKFTWYDGSSTDFFHTLNFTFVDGGSGWNYVPTLKAGNLYMKSSSNLPGFMVCKYP